MILIFHGNFPYGANTTLKITKPQYPRQNSNTRMRSNEKKRNVFAAHENRPHATTMTPKNVKLIVEMAKLLCNVIEIFLKTKTKFFLISPILSLDLYISEVLLAINHSIDCTCLGSLGDAKVN
jgi:hypothetical protein